MTQENVEPPLPEQMFRLLKGLTHLASYSTEEDQKLWRLYDIEDGSRIWIKRDEVNPVFIPQGETDNVLDALLNGPMVIKTKIHIPAVSVEDVAEVLEDVKERYEWDADLLDARVLDDGLNLKRNLSTLYLAYQMNSFWTWPREYFLRKYVHREESDGSIIIAFHSIDPTGNLLEESGKNNTRILGKMNGGFIIQRREDSGVTLSYVCNLYYGGFMSYLPKELIAFAFLRHLQCVLGVKIYMTNDLIHRKARLLTASNLLLSPEATLTRSFSEISLPNGMEEYIKSLIRETTDERSRASSRLSDISFDQSTPESLRYSPPMTPSLDDITMDTSRDNSWVAATPDRTPVFIRTSQSTTVERPPSGIALAASQNVPVVDVPREISSVGLSREDREKMSTMLDDAVLKLKEAFTNRSMWKPAGIKTDVLLYRSISKSGKFHMFRGIGAIRAKPSQIKNVLLDVKNYHSWDPLLKDARIIETIDSNTMVLQLFFETQRCIVKASRDVCIAMRWVAHGNDIVIVGKSVLHPNCPPENGFTRAEVIDSGYWIQPKQDDVTNSSVVTYISQVDLKNLPPTVVNLIAQKQPLLIASIRELLTGKKLHDK